MLKERNKATFTTLYAKKSSFLSLINRAKNKGV